MELFSVLLALCEGNPAVNSGFSSQRPVTWSFDAHFDLRLSKQSRRRWFETPSRSLWRDCIDYHHFAGRCSAQDERGLSNKHNDTMASTYFRNTGPLWSLISKHKLPHFDGFLLHRWIPLRKGQWCVTWCFILCWLEQEVVKTIKWSMIRKGMTW